MLSNMLCNMLRNMLSNCRAKSYNGNNFWVNDGRRRRRRRRRRRVILTSRAAPPLRGRQPKMAIYFKSWTLDQSIRPYTFHCTCAWRSRKMFTQRVHTVPVNVNLAPNNLRVPKRYCTSICLKKVQRCRLLRFEYSFWLKRLQLKKLYCKKFCIHILPFRRH